ncbi:N,N-dimethylformamidase beta subunit family domain-containing protein [Streptomyces sp. NPDC051909]|uniref:N,N-dimethylformamidase beta subunit family domain-containing protein n=1 Tax=Streptomyces sp. NPDC051909 TaxID=3154944 RepID=UPI00341764CD
MTSRLLAGPTRRTVLIAAGAAGAAMASATGAAAAGDPAHLPPRTGDNPVVRENRNPGSGRWIIGAKETRGVDLRRPQIQGCPATASVAPGETLTLHLSAATTRTARTCEIEIHRFGFYGGERSRLLHTAAEVPVGRLWRLPVPGAWVSGVFLAVLTADGYRAYAPFVVREPARSSDVLAVVPLAYPGLRPYPGLGTPATFGADVSAYRWLEEAGYDVTYATEEDVRARRVDPRRHRAVVHSSAAARPAAVPGSVALRRPLALAEPGHIDPEARRQAAALLDGLVRRP